MINIFLILSYWVGNIVRVPLFSATQFSFIDLVVGLIFFVHLPYLWRHRRILHAQSLARATMYVLIMLISSLLVASPLYSYRELFVASLYIIRFGIFTSILFMPYRIPHTAIRVLIGGFVGIGLFQYVLYPNLRYLLYLGWDDHYLRLFGSLLDPNFTGVLLVMMLVALLCRPDGKKSTWVDYAIASLGFVALLITYSRSAFIVAIAAAIALGAIKKKFSLFLALFVLIAGGILFLPTSLPTEGANLFRTASISARSQEYGKAIRIIKENPFSGVGYNAYRYARTKYFDEKPSKFHNNAGAGVPNSYLFIFATSGIFGFVFFIHWLGSLWDEYVRRSTVAAPLLTAFMVSGLFDNTMVYSFILFWVLLILKQTEFADHPHHNKHRDTHIGKAK